jgi:hypothetical protein
LLARRHALFPGLADEPTNHRCEMCHKTLRVDE